MHVLQLSFSFVRCQGYDACLLSTSPVSLTLTLALEHLQQSLDALIPGTECLFLGVDPHLHLFHGLPQQEKLFGLPFVFRLQLKEVLL